MTEAIIYAPPEPYHYDEHVGADTGKGDFKSFRVVLTAAGELWTHNRDQGWKLRDWYKDGYTGKPWFPKRRNFISLVKMAIREGDFR